MKRKTGSFEQFKDMTLAVVRGERKLSPHDPRIWVEAIEGGKLKEGAIRFHSLEAGVKLLSAKNRALLRTIARRRPKSISELAAMTGRAEQNLLRTLRKLTTAGIVRLDRGEGRARKPVVVARKVRFEIDLLGG